MGVTSLLDCILFADLPELAMCYLMIHTQPKASLKRINRYYVKEGFNVLLNKASMSFLIDGRIYLIKAVHICFSTSVEAKGERFFVTFVKA